MTYTTIVGSFQIESNNDTEVMNAVLNTAQANIVQHRVAHDGYIPTCRIGYDDKGVSTIGILNGDEWRMWRRVDYRVHRVHDSHSLCPVYGYDHPGPEIDGEYEFTRENVEYCKDKYSVAMNL